MIIKNLPFNLERAVRFEIFEKMPVISLFWKESEKEVASRFQKPKKDRKTWIYVFRSLRVKHIKSARTTESGELVGDN